MLPSRQSIKRAQQVYAYFLYYNLLDLTDEEKHLADEKAGFREGKSTLDQCGILQFLMYGQYQPLYAVFTDL